MKRPWLTDEWWEEFLRQESEKGKWRFVWRIGILGWGILMVWATNLWFAGLTRYSRLTTLVVSVLVWLPAGAVVGLGLWLATKKVEKERREFWLRQKKWGKGSFVLRYGVLRFGAPMFMFTALCTLTLPSQYMAMTILNLIVWLLGGAFFGVLLWHRLETK
jgi:hypothetical protein